MVSASWDPIAAGPIKGDGVSITVPFTSTLKQVTDVCTRAVNAGTLTQRQAHYLYLGVSMPCDNDEKMHVHIPIESETEWRHFKLQTTEMSLTVRIELRANVFPSRIFTIADLVRHTCAPKVTAWRPPKAALPTLVHSNIDSIQRRQFSGSSIHLIVPSTVTIEPGGVDGMAGSLLFGSQGGVHASQLASTLITHVSVSKPTSHIHMRAFAGLRLRTACFPPTIRHIGSSSFKGTLLTVVDLGHATCLTVVEQSAFQACPQLTTVRLPITIRHIGALCFESCAMLSTVEIDKDAPMLVVEAACYMHTRSLTIAPIANSLISIQQDGFRMSGLTIVDLSATHVSCIGDRAFSQCTRLTKFTGSPALMALGTLVFADCTQLEHVDLSNSRGLTFTPPGCFDNCTALTHVALPTGLRSIRENGFRNCRRLTSILLPHTVGSIGPLAFSNTRNLRAIRIMGASLPDISTSALKHSAAVIISLHTTTPADSPAVVAVPARLATNAASFASTLLALRLSNADHHRRCLRDRVKQSRKTATNVDLTRERRHRRHFADMPVLPLEIWLMILQHNSAWPSKLAATFYFPRLLHKPATLVWKRWFDSIPPLLAFLFNDCSQSDVKLLSRHTSADMLPKRKGTLLPTHVYTVAYGTFPDCMTHYDYDHQMRIVKRLMVVLKGSCQANEEGREMISH